MTREDWIQGLLALLIGYSIAALTGCTIPWHVG
jgi:hypothetical protein